jgi:hypothetical protein
MAGHLRDLKAIMLKSRPVRRMSMAKALFHKTQRVYVKPVGTWALIEQVIPYWVKNLEEPMRVTYDVGLGREFTAGELVSEAAMNRRQPGGDEELDAESWRIFRMRNRWQDGDETGHHPYPGTFPVVMTDENNWGGWRVPGAEYDRNPSRIEHQARMIANAPHMVRVLRALAEFASETPHDLPEDLLKQASESARILRNVHGVATSETEPRAKAG